MGEVNSLPLFSWSNLKRSFDMSSHAAYERLKGKLNDRMRLTAENNLIVVLVELTETLKRLEKKIPDPQKIRL